jgi:hypothetical protein
MDRASTLFSRTTYSVMYECKTNSIVIFFHRAVMHDLNEVWCILRPLAWSIVKKYLRALE